MTATMIPERPASAPPVTSFRGPRAYLSNTYRCPVVFEDTGYPGAEWAFQAAKSLDPMVRNAMAAMPDWREAKSYGRAIQLRPSWDGVKRVVMMRILMDKFTRNPGLGAALVLTGSALLIEGNTWGDAYWGAVPSGQAVILPPGAGEPPAWDTGDGLVLVGHNWLGWELMMIRDLIRPEGAL